MSSNPKRLKDMKLGDSRYLDLDGKWCTMECYVEVLNCICSNLKTHSMVASCLLLVVVFSHHLVHARKQFWPLAQRLMLQASVKRLSMLCMFVFAEW